jgi:hypothetical protein
MAWKIPMLQSNTLYLFMKFKYAMIILFIWFFYPMNQINLDQFRFLFVCCEIPYLFWISAMACERVCYPVSLGTGRMEYKISHVMQIDPTAVQSKRHHHHINIYIIQVPCNQAKYMLPFVLYISQTTDYVDWLPSKSRRLNQLTV